MISFGRDLPIAPRLDLIARSPLELINLLSQMPRRAESTRVAFHENLAP